MSNHVVVINVLICRALVEVLFNQRETFSSSVNCKTGAS